jgi:very-short-patch-repair endonuclease
MSRMKRFSWNINTMNQYCIDNNIDYKILDIKQIDKKYQKQLWALVKCPNKNHKSYWVWWNNFIKGNRCKLCFYENNNKTLWTIEKVIEFYKNYGLDIIDINQWVDVDIPIDTIDDCGFKFKSSITNIKQMGNKSSYIFNVYNPHSLDNIKLFCKLFRQDYEIISEKYIGIKKEYIWKYIGYMLPENEDKFFKATADSFINGGCVHPYFSSSKGESMFEELLKINNIKYIKQKTFKGCKDKILLRFDFYLPYFNEVVEIDGLQHTTSIESWGGEKQFNNIKRKDEIKNNYCISNGIKITRILYDHTNKEMFKKLIDNKILEIKNININK